MSSYANIAEITAFQSFGQGEVPRRRNWLETWLDARRAKTAQRRLAEELRFMDRLQLADIGIDPASFSATTVRLAQLNPAVISFSLFSPPKR